MNIGGPARAVIELAKGLPQLLDPSHPDHPSVDKTYEQHEHSTHRRGSFNVTVAAGDPPPEEGQMSDPEVPVLRLPLLRQISPASDWRSLLAIRRVLVPPPSQSCTRSITSNTSPAGVTTDTPSIISSDGVGISAANLPVLDGTPARSHETGSPATGPNTLPDFPSSFISGPFDLVNTHMAKAGALGRMAALSTRVRPILVHTFHGHVLEGYFPTLPSRALIGLEWALAHKTDALVAVSSEIRDELLSLGIGKPWQWHVIPLGLDLDGYLSIPLPEDTSSYVSARRSTLRDTLSIPRNALLLAIIGRLVPVKNHSTALRALAAGTLPPGVSPTGSLPSNGPSSYSRAKDASLATGAYTSGSSAAGSSVTGTSADDSFAIHLLVVGDGELRTRLEEEARSLGVASRVHFLGWRTDIPEILAQTDIVVLTSLKEGTPAVLIEAAAAGRPVVSSDVGGIRSIVEHKETGLLVPPGNPIELALSIRFLADHPQLRRAMGIRARRIAVDRFGTRRFVRDTADLYYDLLASGKVRNK